MTRFSKCTPYFQVWPTFQNVTPLIHVWPFFTSVTNISKLEHLFFFKGDPFFPSVTHCSLFSQTFYGFLFSYLTITDVTSYVHHKFPVSFLLYIATKNTCQINQIITVNSSMNAPISETYSSQKNNSCTPCVPMFGVSYPGGHRQSNQPRPPHPQGLSQAPTSLLYFQWKTKGITLFTRSQHMTVEPFSDVSLSNSSRKQNNSKFDSSRCCFVAKFNFLGRFYFSFLCFLFCFIWDDFSQLGAACLVAYPWCHLSYHIQQTWLEQ